MDGRKQKGRWVDQRGRAEEEEEFPLSVLRIHLSVTSTLVHSSACTNTHTIGFGLRTSDRRGNSSHATLCVCVCPHRDAVSHTLFYFYLWKQWESSATLNLPTIKSLTEF